MEIRLLETFLTIVEEGTISQAAVKLHISQPALSRQLRELEKSVGTQLLIRSNKQVQLTPAGRTLRTRAQDILSMVHTTREELAHPPRNIHGQLRIGAAESSSFGLIAKVIAEIQQDHPPVQAIIQSGNGYFLETGIDASTLTFGLFIEPWDLSRYKSIQMPETDVWGLLVRSDSQLAQLEHITVGQLSELPILTPERVVDNDGVSDWLSTGRAHLTVVGTYNLLFNAIHMVKQSIGSALCIDGLVAADDPSLTFIPLHPRMESRLHLAWRTDRHLTPLEQLFVDQLEATMAGMSER